MTMQEGPETLGLGTAARHDRAYFLDLLGDSLAGLGRYETAVEAYREAVQGFEVQDAPCSRALCLFKIADCYMSLREPWHALGYLEACLPLLREQGLVRYFSLAQDQLAACRAKLASLVGEGRHGHPRRPVRPGQRHRLRAGGKFRLCPVPKASRTG
jgi:tetratricopeptide (TPR) repeat protein